MSARSIQLKEEGNLHFGKGDYAGAEGLYSKAYVTNPLLSLSLAPPRWPEAAGSVPARETAPLLRLTAAAMTTEQN